VSKTRAIRFSEMEDLKIIEFLERNTFFDFSTLSRLAILEFIQNPRLTIIPVSNLDLAIKKSHETEEQ
jgi:hypothetical protein